MASTRLKMPEAYSAEFWLAILRSLDIGIAVHCVQSSGRKEVFRNAKAASFEELGRAAPCIKLTEKEITFSRENSGPDSPGGSPDMERFVVEVTCNPLA